MMNNQLKYRQKRIRLVLLNMLLVMILIVGGVTPASAGDTRQDIPTIDPALLSQSERSDSLDYLIYFEEEADLSAAFNLSWEARGWFVYETLTAHADQSQARVRKYLDAVGVNYTAFWAQNVIFVESSTRATLNGLLNFTEIETLQANMEVMLIEPTPVDGDVSTEFAGTRAAMSNLVRINADDVWALGYRGEGLVVGSIDTGVRFTHEALIAQYRGNQGAPINHNYNWWDAVNGYTEPFDDHGHGSHVTGTMVGTDGSGNQIGVAPGATWIACRGLDASGGTGQNLLACGQFMLAPWDLTRNNADPDMRPHVVNNSWGNCDRSYNAWYAGTIDAWIAAGIYPIFANGNASNCGYSYPPGLNTVGNPARSYHVTAVGSTGTNNGTYATHSNWGPTDSSDTINGSDYPNIKPQVVAPGVSIRSSVASSDDAYGYWTGTSMSAPHVAGLIPLIWQAAPCLLGKYATTETLIQNTAFPIPYATGNGDEGPANIPNHATGWGEINALAAVDAAIEMCAGPNIDGKVFDSLTRLPIPGATIFSQASGNGANSRDSQTYTSGYYIQDVVMNETYTVRADVAGYQDSIPIQDIVVSSTDIPVTVNFYLDREGLIKIFLPLIQK